MYLPLFVALFWYALPYDLSSFAIVLTKKRGLVPRLYNLSSFSNSKYSAMIGCFRTGVRKQPIIALYFESEAVIKFYNLGAWLLCLYFLSDVFLL